MNKRGRNRHNIILDRKRHLADLAESKPAPGAVKAFSRKAYECCDVLGYMVKKYDIKGEIGIGEEGIRADKEFP